MSKNCVISEEVQIHPSIKLGNNVVIDSDVVLGENVEIGNNVVIHSGTVIGEGTKILDNCILARVPIATRSIERKVADSLPKLEIGSHCVIGVSAVLYRGTTIGNEVLIADAASIREGCTIGNNCVISRGVTINYNTKIGARTKVMDLTHLTGDMIVEEDVFISVGVSSTNDNTMGRQNYGEDHVKGPIIRKFATIGGGVCLLPGVEVGENSVVGMGAVVSKSIPPRKVAMGVPAKVIKDVEEELIKK